MLSFIITLPLFILYFLPIFIAFSIKFPNPNAGPKILNILTINFFLGWTIVGWIVALIMAIKFVLSQRSTKLENINAKPQS